MKFKDFVRWCNERVCDGCWGFQTARICIDILRQVRRRPFWKREKAWQAINEGHWIETMIIDPINQKIEQIRQQCDDEERGKQ